MLVCAHCVALYCVWLCVCVCLRAYGEVCGRFWPANPAQGADCLVLATPSWTCVCFVKSDRQHTHAMWVNPQVLS